MPWMLGGHGKIETIFEDEAYPVHAPGLKELALVTMGYHLGRLMATLFG